MPNNQTSSKNASYVYVATDRRGRSEQIKSLPALAIQRGFELLKPLIGAVGFGLAALIWQASNQEDAKNPTPVLIEQKLTRKYQDVKKRQH